MTDPEERAEIRAIEQEELAHRRCVREMLRTLGEEPERLRELRMACIGRSIAMFCRVGGWFLPMYGAGRLESRNVVEYECAARLALAAGYQLLGAINYYAISQPTLTGIFGDDAYQQLDASFRDQLYALIDAVILAGVPE